MSSLNDKVNRLTQELIKAHSQQAVRDSLKAQSAAEAQRKKENRQKLLLGAMLLATVKKGGKVTISDQASITAAMDVYLTSKADRAVFDLPEKEKAEKAAPAPVQPAPVAPVQAYNSSFLDDLPRSGRSE